MEEKIENRDDAKMGQLVVLPRLDNRQRGERGVEGHKGSIYGYREYSAVKGWFQTVGIRARKIPLVEGGEITRVLAMERTREAGEGGNGPDRRSASDCSLNSLEFPLEGCCVGRHWQDRCGPRGIEPWAISPFPGVAGSKEVVIRPFDDHSVGSADQLDEEFGVKPQVLFGERLVVLTAEYGEALGDDRELHDLVFSIRKTPRVLVYIGKPDGKVNGDYSSRLIAGNCVPQGYDFLLHFRSFFVRKK